MITFSQYGHWAAPKTLTFFLDSVICNASLVLTEDFLHVSFEKPLPVSASSKYDYTWDISIDAFDLLEYHA
jgi:hypothetical protein